MQAIDRNVYISADAAISLAMGEAVGHPIP